MRQGEIKGISEMVPHLKVQEKYFSLFYRIPNPLTFCDGPCEG